MPETIEAWIDAVKPDAIYFTVKDGQRTIIAVVNIPSEDKMVATPEPLSLDGNCAVTFTPAMSPADLQKSGKERETFAKAQGMLKLCSFSFLW